jgi:hypothetical protein
MDVQLLRQADQLLSTCGRPVLPTNLSYVDIPHYFYAQVVVPGLSTIQFLKEIEGDTEWNLRAISGFQGVNAAYLQIKYPNGHYYENFLQSFAQLQGVGSARLAIDPEVPIVPGSKFYITADTSLPATNTSVPLALMLDGFYRYYSKNVPLTVSKAQSQLASQMPRVVIGENQNILAPPWAFGRSADSVLTSKDSVFTYVSPATTIAVSATTPSTTVTSVITPVTSSSLFKCRRIMFASLTDQGVTATLFGRIRLSSGYNLTNDFVDLNNLNALPLPKYWDICRGDSIIVDVITLDIVGVGNVYLQFYFEGAREK